MTWENVYQSEMCCEFSGLTDDAVPQLDVAAFANRDAAHHEQDGGGRGDGDDGGQDVRCGNVAAVSAICHRAGS